MPYTRLLLVLVAALALGSVDAKSPKGDKKKNAGHPGMGDFGMDARMKEHMHEMEHLKKYKVEDVSDWSLHTDVDDSVYCAAQRLEPERSRTATGVGAARASGGARAAGSGLARLAATLAARAARACAHHAG